MQVIEKTIRVCSGELTRYGTHFLRNELFDEVNDLVTSQVGKIIWETPDEWFMLGFIELINNSADAILDRIYGEWLEEGTIKIYIDKKAERVRLVVRDNWAWIYASGTQRKEKTWMYLGWEWVGEKTLGLYGYRRISTLQGSVSRILLPIFAREESISG